MITKFELPALNYRLISNIKNVNTYINIIKPNIKFINFTVRFKIKNSRNCFRTFPTIFLAYSIY